MLRVRDGSGQVSYTLLRDGSYSRSGVVPPPLRASISESYACSADMLRLSVPGGVTDQFARGTP